ncbi:hypothetical protein [Panacagrimonas sp.]|uniref:hypothetical protein n=1 Tax=Panacagrimonas sp. TaxID=2480088 RepID=UPI003B52751D
MNILVLSLLASNLVLAVLLLLGWHRLRKALTTLEARQAQLDGAAEPALMQMAQDACPTLSIRILNPVELAVQKHWAAGALGRLTPGLLRQIVGREAARIVALELPRYGAQAEIRVVDARG